MTLIDDKILLTDFGSKFGTLALIQNVFKIESKLTSLQIGRTYMELNIKSTQDPVILKQMNFASELIKEDNNNSKSLFNQEQLI